MKQSLHISIKFSIAIILIISVLLGYWTEPDKVIELTCLSNLGLGIVFLISAIRQLRGKEDFSNSIYSTGLVTILFVFLICLGSLSGMYHLNFKGAFIFLHVINPVLVLGYYLLFISEKEKGSLKKIFINPFFTLGYLFLDYVIGNCVKHYVYGFFEPGELGIVMAVEIGGVIYLILLAIGGAVYGINCGLNLSKRWNRVEKQASMPMSMEETIDYCMNAAVEIGREDYGVALDFSDESIGYVNGILDGYHKRYLSVQEGAAENENFNAYAMIWGIYAGEVLKRQYGNTYEWKKTEQGIVLGDHENKVINPIGKARKQIVNGKENGDDIQSFFKVAVAIMQGRMNV